eukprot:458154_1
MRIGRQCVHYVFCKASTAPKTRSSTGDTRPGHSISSFGPWSPRWEAWSDATGAYAGRSSRASETGANSNRPSPNPDAAADAHHRGQNSAASGNGIPSRESGESAAS